MNKIFRTFRINSSVAFEETEYPDICHMAILSSRKGEEPVLIKIPLNRSDLETMVHLFRTYASDGNHIKFVD